MVVHTDLAEAPPHPRVPDRPRARVADGPTCEPKWGLLRAFGRRPIHYSTMQEGLQTLYVERRDGQEAPSGPVGYVAYTRVGRVRPDVFVLGDPICARRDLGLVLDRFLAVVPDPTFWQVSRDTARALRARGFYVNHCGVETSLDVPAYEVSGSEKQNLRTAVSKARRHGVVIREQRMADVDGASVRRISDAWIRGRVVDSGELTFLARRAVFDRDEPHVRRFFAYRGGSMLGYVFFNPLFSNGRVFGYTADITRFADAAPKGLAYAVVLHALEVFRREGGVECLSLGWSPLYKIEDNEFDHSVFTTLYFVLQYQLANGLYNYKGQAKNKAAYRGCEEHVYFASRHRAPVRQIYRTYCACDIRPVRQVRRALFGKQGA